MRTTQGVSLIPANPCKYSSETSDKSASWAILLSLQLLKLWQLVFGITLIFLPACAYKCYCLIDAIKIALLHLKLLLPRANFPG